MAELDDGVDLQGRQQATVAQRPVVGEPAAESAAPGEPVALTRVRRLRADRARQVADVLRAQILRGDYPHRTLPDERALMLEFGESRNTVRDALDLLRCDGLVERQQGVGTLVTAQKYAHGLNRLMGLAGGMAGIESSGPSS